MTDSENVEYQYKRAKGLLDRVTAQLKGTQSAVVTRLVKRLKKIDKQMEDLKKERENIDKQLRKKYERLFDPEEETLTRVIETLSVTATLAKKTDPGTGTKIDYENAYKKLYKLYPELSENLDEVLGMYTETYQLQQKKPKLQTKVKEDENDKGLIEKFKKYINKFAMKFELWGKKYDQKLEEIKNDFDIQLNEEPVSSSWIGDLEMDDDEDIVTMTTHDGREYDISGMDEQDYADWMDANSKGKHWHRNVKRS